MKTTHHISPTQNPLEFYKQLQAFELIHNETPSIAAYLEECGNKQEVPSVYAGFDPSAASLQVGNLVAVLALRRAQLCGIRPLTLLGGATGLIGDPSGKKQERTLLDQDIAEANLQKIKAQLSSLIDIDKGKYQMKFVNNYDWFSELGFIDFLRSVGKHITINYMIAKDSVKLRMETGISYAEFGYMLIQGYDFLHLFEKENCRIQIGGSDQWGNITTGIELIRRKHGAEAHAISAPLLTDAAGNKLGKTEGGAVYLDPSLTSPYQFFQYWLNQADTDVGKILRSLTLFSLDYIHSLEAEIKNRPEARMAQRELAKEITTTVHGKEAAIAAEKAGTVLFSKDPKSLDNLDSQTLAFLQNEVPSSTFRKNETKELTELLVETKLTSSKGDSRRQIQGNAVSINRVKVQDEKLAITQETFQNRNFLLLSLGKTKIHLVILAD